MGKVLRISVVVVLVLGGIALWLAVLNYNKREILVGRTQKLEDAWVRLATTIEREDPEMETEADFPARDVSPVEARVVESPDFSPFWNTYNQKLEIAGMPTFNLRTTDAQAQLQRYFAVGPDGKRQRDPVRGGFQTTGDGTMQALLDTVLERATQQYGNLNRTRGQLEALRTEHVRTIEEINREKQARRQALIRQEELRAEAQRLQREKREDEARISRLEADKRELQLEIADRTEQINRNNEQIQNLRADIERLTEDLARARRVTAGPQPIAETDPDVERTLTAGEKGRIVSVDAQWGFVITELTPEFMVELFGPETESRPLPRIEMMVRRPGFDGPAGEFITKLRLRHLVPDENIVIADILSDWQQVTPQKDDVLFF